MICCASAFLARWARGALHKVASSAKRGMGSAARCSTAFEGDSKEQVDEYLRDFYDEVIAGQEAFSPQSACGYERAARCGR